MTEIDSNRFSEDVNIIDNVATFILRYKNHVESRSRVDDVQCVQQCQHLLESRCKEVLELEMKNVQLQQELTEYKQRLKDTNNIVRSNFQEIEHLLSDVLKRVCGGKKHTYEYDKIDEILDKTTKIIKEINNIYEK